MKNCSPKRTVGVYTSDDYLFQKIKLELLGECEVIRMTERSDAEAADLALTDADDEKYRDFDGLKMKRGGGRDIALPFRLGSLRDMIGGEADILSAVAEEKCAILSGRRIKLTELEYALFSLLLSRCGEFVSREEILNVVWGGRADSGIVNVYVHYLREKLETDGERIIVSSRNYGYKIDERYAGGKHA